MTQEEIDDIIYITGNKAEEFLKEKYKNFDINIDIENYIDFKDETLYGLIDSSEKFDKLLKEYDDLDSVDAGFKSNMKQIYPQLNLEV